jgi:hypothetical protein
MSATVLASLIFNKRRSAREIIPQSALEIPVPIGRLQILFSPKGIAFIFAGFVVDKCKRQAAFGGINLPCLMQFKALSQIARATDIKPLIGFR